MPNRSTEAPVPSRRKLLKGALAASVAPTTLPTAAAPGGDSERTRHGRGERPNIIFILADDLGWADLGCYGHPEIHTPVLDELARQGTRLTQAYSNSAVCTPTRVGFLTGRYQQRLPIGLQEPLAYVGQLTPQQRTTLGIPPDHPTIASLLAAAGYETALIGKWHAGYLPAFSPIKSGFKHFYGVFSGGVDYFSHQDNNGEPDLWEGETSIKDNGYITQLLSRRAQRFIERSAASSRPFYLSLHYTSPHWPWEGPSDAARSGHTGSLFDNNGGSLKIYKSMVENLDAEIGRVLQTLRATGQERQTLIVFTSDNGGERFSNMWPFFGKKDDLYEGGIRVPAIVRWPGVVRRGIVSPQVAITMDWTATFLAAANAQAQPSYPLDGQDLLPVLSGWEPVRTRELFWRMRGRAAARIGDLKYLQIGSTEYLFDLAADVREQANVAPLRPEDLATLRTRYQAWNAGVLPQT